MAGLTARRVTSQCPAWRLLRNRVKMGSCGFQLKLLLAIDNSKYSVDAINEVARRPWPTKTIVRVLSVLEPFPPSAVELWYDVRGSLERAQQEMTKRATELTQKASERLKRKELKIEPAAETDEEEPLTNRAQ